MKIIQTVAQSGKHLVLTLTEVATGKVLSRRVWENAAQYIRPSPEYWDTDLKENIRHLTLEIPSKSGLDFC